MKVKSISLLVLAVAWSACAFSQGFHLGIKGGANLYKIDGQSFDESFKYGYNAGVFAEINFNKHLGLQPEIIWNQSQTRTTSDFHAIYHTSGNDLTDIKLNYLSLPLLLSYRPAKFLSLQAGPQFGILINRDQDLLHNGKNAFKSGDVSLLGGVQLNLGGIKVGGRYVVSVTDINNLGDEETWRNHGFQVYLGFRIF